MKKSLPARPNLEHLRTQAKELLTQLKKGDKNQSKPRLADAQLAIARKSGFASWPELVHHVEQLRQLEGTWEFVDLEVDGAAMPSAMLGNSRILIDGDRFRTESPEGNYEGIFTIDVAKDPHQIDIEFIEGPEAGNWSYGIFVVDSDEFKICLSLTGAPRPGAFATKPNSGHALENLRRVLKTRPADVKGGKPQAQKQKQEAVRVDESAFKVEMTPLLRKLQGEWLPVQLIQNGQAMQEGFLSFGSRSFEGNETKVVFGGQVMVHAKLRIDESQSPIAVDYLNVGRSAPGQISLGVLEWLGDEVQFCMSSPGQPRPLDFSCEPKSGRTLSRWKRK